MKLSDQTKSVMMSALNKTLQNIGQEIARAETLKVTHAKVMKLAQAAKAGEFEPDDAKLAVQILGSFPYAAVKEAVAELTA